MSEATRVTPNSSSLLDPIFLNNPSILRNSTVLPNFCSDHSPSVVEINFSTPREKAYSRIVRDYDHSDYTSIQSYFREIDWYDKFGDSDDVNELNDILNHEVKHVRDTFVPEKRILVRPRDKPWISSDIKQKIRRRNRLYKKAKTRNLASDWEKYRDIRNEVINMIREAKKTIFDKIA